MLRRVVATASLLLSMVGVVGANSGIPNRGGENTADRRAVTVQDLMELRGLHDVAMSPDGKSIAYVVSHADLDSNSWRDTLFTTSTDAKSEPHKLFEKSSILGASWSPDGKSLTFLTDDEEHQGRVAVWRSVEGSSPSILITAESDILDYAWAPDGRTIAFVVSNPAPGNRDVEVQPDDSIVFGNASSMPPYWQVTACALSKRMCTFASVSELWSFDARTQASAKLWSNSAGSIQELSWAPNSRAIAFTYETRKATYPAPSSVGYFSIDRKNFKSVAEWPGYTRLPKWSADSKELAFISDGDLSKVAPYGYQDAVYTANVSVTENPKKLIEYTEGVRLMRWSSQSRALQVGVGGNLFSVDTKTGDTRQMFARNLAITEVSMSKDGSFGAAIVEDVDHAPEVALIDLNRETMLELTAVNPQLGHLKFGEVSELTLQNRYGYTTSNWLIRPVGYVEGIRYPLLIIMYGFTRAYSAQAQWIANYPAQVFAANGFAVLLWNPPKVPKWEAAKFEEGYFGDVENPVASIEEAVRVLVAEGITDPGKVGLMGWSQGGHWTNQAVARSTMFTAASSGEASRRDPAAYWISGDRFASLIDSIVGGPPVNGNIRNWIQYAPSLMSPPLKTPVLFEFQAGDPSAPEVFQSWKKQGGLVELVLYPNEGHNFHQPKHQLSAMTRNLDWFRFWLQGWEDQDGPGKKAQYERWRLMREKRDARKDRVSYAK